MLTVENLVILVLIVLSFISGKKISDSYNEKRISEIEYQLRLMAAEKGVGYVVPPAPRSTPIGQPFMDKLKENGRATQRIEKHQTT